MFLLHETFIARGAAESDFIVYLHHRAHRSLIALAPKQPQNKADYYDHTYACYKKTIQIHLESVSLLDFLNANQ